MKKAKIVQSLLFEEYFVLTKFKDNGSGLVDISDDRYKYDVTDDVKEAIAGWFSEKLLEAKKKGIKPESKYVLERYFELADEVLKKRKANTEGADNE